MLFSASKLHIISLIKKENTKKITFFNKFITLNVPQFKNYYYFCTVFQNKHTKCCTSLCPRWGWNVGVAMITLQRS